MTNIIKELIDIKNKITDFYQVVQDYDNIKSLMLKDLCKQSQMNQYNDIQNSMISLIENIGKSPEFRAALVLQKQNEANEAYRKVQKQFGFPEPLDQHSILRPLDEENYIQAVEKYQSSIQQINQLNSDIDVKLEMKKYGFVDIDDRNGNEVYLKNEKGEYKLYSDVDDESEFIKMDIVSRFKNENNNNECIKKALKKSKDKVIVLQDKDGNLALTPKNKLEVPQSAPEIDNNKLVIDESKSEFGENVTVKKSSTKKSSKRNQKKNK